MEKEVLRLLCYSPSEFNPLHEVLLLESGCFWLSQCQAAITTPAWVRRIRVSALRAPGLADGEVTVPTLCGLAQTPEPTSL